MDSTDVLPSAPAPWDFDEIVPRRGTDSVKWNQFPPDVLPLWIADLDFPSPPAVIEALHRRVAHGLFGYRTDPVELYGAIQDRLYSRYNWRVEPEEFVPITGVVAGLNLVFRTVGGPGDGVLLQPPIYPPFFAAARHSARTIQTAPLVLTGRGYEIDFDLLERAISPRTRALLLCSPHNPVGRVFTRAELERIAEICLRHDLVICSDEIHQDFVYEGHSHIPIATLGPEVAARTVTLLSASKSYNLPGFHLAVALMGNRQLRERITATGAGLFPHRPGVLDAVATVAAYRHGNDWLAQLVRYLQRNRDLVVRYVRDHLPGISVVEPEATYLAWLDCREAGIQGSPAEFFLREARVALNDGVHFGEGGEGFIRLNFGCPRVVLEEALGRMKEALLAFPVL